MFLSGRILHMYCEVAKAKESCQYSLVNVALLTELGTFCTSLLFFVAVGTMAYCIWAKPALFVHTCIVYLPHPRHKPDFDY